jgi:uncharacterized protein
MPAGSGGTLALTPEVRVRVHGQDLPAEAAGDLLAVEVHEDLDTPSMFTFRLINWDMNKLQVTWSDAALFSPGNEVEIQMGYLGQLQVLLRAEITGLEPEFNADDMPTVTVRGYDRRHRLLRGRRSQSFLKMKDSDIAAKIASDVGLASKTDPTRVELEYVAQHNQTDLEFLQDRAARLGFEVVVDDKTLLFRARKNASHAALHLDPTIDLLDFSPRLSTMGQVTEVKVRGWDPRAKHSVEGKASTQATKMAGTKSGPEAARTAFGAASVAVVDRPIFSQAEADQIAEGRFNTLALTYVVGDGACQGNPGVRAGTVVTLSGLGKRFSGDYYVTATQHTFSSQGYRTVFTVRRNAT